MPVRFFTALPAELTKASSSGPLAKLEHGELLVGKVARISQDGTAHINFAGMEARARGGKLLQAGRRVLAQVQKARDETMLSLLPNIRDGEVLSGTALRRAGSGILTRFRDIELAARPGAKAEIPQPGTQVRAQVQLHGTKPALQLLDSGNNFSGTVVAVRSDGTVLVDVEGTTLVAASSEPVSVGDQVRAVLLPLREGWILQILPKGSTTETALSERLTGTTAELIGEQRLAGLLQALASEQLKIGGGSRELLALLLQQIPEGAKEQTWFSGLVRVLESILLNPQKGELAQQLPSAFENSGLFLESRLLRAAITGKTETSIFGDLKLALLLAVQKLSQQPRQGAAGKDISAPQLNVIAGKVGQLLDTVTAEQFLNLRAIPSNEIYVQIPFAPDSALEDVEIHISPQGKQDTKKLDAKNVLLTLGVSTSNLGRIKAALLISDARVTCRLKAEREPVVKLLADNAELLKAGLEKLNYEVAYIDCSLSKSESEMSIVKSLSQSPPKGLDVRV